MTLVIIGIILLVLAVLGTPLFAVLAGLALVLFAMSDTGIVVLTEEHYKLATSPHLITIPLFTLSGFLMAKSKAADRLINVSNAVLGWMPGGLAVVVIAACAFFTTFTGASGVTIVALGGLLFPMMVQDGYPERFSHGLITASGSIGLLFPPSLPIILYGIVAMASVDKLFVAGILPGALMVGVLSIYAMIVSKRSEVERIEFVPKEALSALWEAKWEVMVPVVVLVSIYGGFVTIAEASAIAALYVLIVEVFILKDITLLPDDSGRADLASVIYETMVMVGAILVILGVAMGLTNYLVQEQVPMQILEFIRQYIDDRTTFLLVLTVFLLIVGCMMDIFSAIAVVVPLITPIAADYGVDPIHLGIIFLANLEIGYITPPVGLNLFISSLAFDKPVVYLYRTALPFLFLLLGTLLVITFWEDLSLTLVRLLVGG
ncbi:TRAP transporter large permease [Persicimonas caeni]|uniref:TRAP transporter large permease n=1 Tax=Persicimonas caeni TaxID=2292766 RepID=A0A4Y6PPB0_PERCE|nr:TRAP transporter large permease [Persicimonas caeni]QDG49625.1 TRAP transporter large permease [Persicimonas caeni]QED30846.1 TRAP transporter large permease [Persicimonas caeni]